jgi:hypothetical protein
VTEKETDSRGRDHMVVQSVPITTKVVSSNPAHGEVYSIQHYLIKLVSDLVDFFKSSTLKPLSHMNRNLVGASMEGLL